MPKISIIIPVYNTEKYLVKCIDSLLYQSLEDIEIICVNDGSTDNSQKILDNYAKKDKRIKVIHQENKKQGAARNRGMEIATGEYIGYVDSDDWVDFDYFEELYIAAKKHNLDIALATNVRIGNGKTKKRLKIEKEHVALNLQEKLDLCNQFKNECPTNKIYRRKFLIENNIAWPEGVYCEDKIYTLKAIFWANGIVSVPDVNYYYFRRHNSTVKSNKQSKIDKNKAKKEVIKFLKENNANIRDKEIWATKKEFKMLGIPFLTIKESLRTEKYCLFSCIPCYERLVYAK